MLAVNEPKAYYVGEKPSIFQHVMKEITRICIVLAALLAFYNTAIAENHDISRLSIRDTGIGSITGDSIDPNMSSDGSFVVFSSDANDLVSDDFDTNSDIFLINRSTPTPVPVRISTDSGGDDSDGDNDQPHISADGKVIVFRSDATDLVVGPLTRATPQVYLYNRLGTPTPRPTPVASPGPLALISVDDSGTPGNGSSYSPHSSNDGSYVVFASESTNFSTTCNTVGRSQIFLFDASQSSSPLSCVSVNSDSAAGNGNSYAPRISKDGAYVVFESVATNLTSVDTQGRKNIFLLNRATSAITLISADTGAGVAEGDSSNPSINADGTYVAFDTTAPDILPGCPSESGRSAVILHKISDGTKTCGSVTTAGVNCNGNSIKPVLSGDANTVVYQSDCINLVQPETKLTPASGQFDLYKYVQGTPSITRENTTTIQTQVTPGVGQVAVSNDGALVAFDSAAALVFDDSNEQSDIFITNTACTTDSDGDGTADCSDECYLDAAKTTTGVCGCGVAETDSDADGTPNCSDLCSSDASKTAPGSCGCGFAETDVDGNGASDCIEPTTTTLPDQLGIKFSKRNRRIVAQIPIAYLLKNYRFSVQLMKDGKVIAKRTTTKKQAAFKNLGSGRYQVRYRITTGLGDTTKFSRRQRVRL